MQAGRAGRPPARAALNSRQRQMRVGPLALGPRRVPTGDVPGKRLGDGAAPAAAAQLQPARIGRRRGVALGHLVVGAVEKVAAAAASHTHRGGGGGVRTGECMHAAPRHQHLAFPLPLPHPGPPPQPPPQPSSPPGAPHVGAVVGGVHDRVLEREVGLPVVDHQLQRLLRRLGAVRGAAGRVDKHVGLRTARGGGGGEG